MDGVKLKAKLVEKNMNVETLAMRIGVDRSTLYRKINNFEQISIGEALRIKDILGLTNAEATEIFFGSKVS